MAEFYFWFKALHIISVISWMAALLYMPRLFVNHVACEPGSQASEMLKGMEGRLLRIIMRPAAVATFGFGIALILVPGLVDWGAIWIWIKLILVAGLGFMHGKMERWCGDFARDANKHTARFYRMVNEVPTLLMIGIVFVVVFKPI